MHTSIAGGISRSIERAVSLGCNTMQIFSHNPRQWSTPPIRLEETDEFALLKQKYDINPVFIHASYLINPASGSETVLRKSVNLLSYELMRADALGVEHVVLHTGGARGKDAGKSRGRAAKSLLQSVRSGKYHASILLENTAGAKGDITSSIQGLAEIIDKCNCEGIGGICIDTCHAFASGYDLTAGDGVDGLLSEVDEYLGIDMVKLIHLNDSKRPSGSGIDRHEHIGKGFIGLKGFENLLSDKRIAHVPIILETPKKTEDDDKRNLKTVLDILSRVPVND